MRHPRPPRRRPAGPRGRPSHPPGTHRVGPRRWPRATPEPAAGGIGQAAGHRQAVEVAGVDRCDLAPGGRPQVRLEPAADLGGRSDPVAGAQVAHRGRQDRAAARREPGRWAVGREVERFVDREQRPVAEVRVDDHVEDARLHRVSRPPAGLDTEQPFGQRRPAGCHDDGAGGERPVVRGADQPRGPITLQRVDRGARLDLHAPIVEALAEGRHEGRPTAVEVPDAPGERGAELAERRPRREPVGGIDVGADAHRRLEERPGVGIEALLAEPPREGDAVEAGVAGGPCGAEQRPCGRAAVAPRRPPHHLTPEDEAHALRRRPSGEPDADPAQLTGGDAAPE